MDDRDLVTLVVRHRIKPGKQASYEQWLRRTTRIASSYPGHLGVNVMRDGPRFVCVLRFSGASELQAWLDSAERRLLIEEVTPLLDDDGDQIEVEACGEFWFTPNAEPPPLRWKQACVTFAVILPLSLLVPLAWTPVFRWQPWLGGYLASNVMITLSIVLLVVYLFMPRVTMWFATWLARR